MEAKRILTIPAIPERLRLAYFKGTEAEQDEREKLDDLRDGIFTEAFQAVSSGAASVAWWTVRGGDGLRILHNSTRGDGLQLSRLVRISGEYEPCSHADISRDDVKHFLSEMLSDGCGPEIRIA